MTATLTPWCVNWQLQPVRWGQKHTAQRLCVSAAIHSDCVGRRERGRSMLVMSLCFCCRLCILSLRVRLWRMLASPPMKTGIHGDSSRIYVSSCALRAPRRHCSFDCVGEGRCDCYTKSQSRATGNKSLWIRREGERQMAMSNSLLWQRSVAGQEAWQANVSTSRQWHKVLRSGLESSCWMVSFCCPFMLFIHCALRPQFHLPILKCYTPLSLYRLIDWWP